MNYEMNNRVVLITGGTQGLGKGIAKKFLESEATVIITGRNKDTGAKAQADLERLGNVEYYCADVSDENVVKELINYIVNKYKKIDYIVNNAATFNPNMKLHEVDSDAFKHLLGVDVMGTFFCMKYGIIQMLTQEERGRIVNISSNSSLKELSGLSPYVAAKHAINGITRVAALDYALDNIRINAVCPGMIETEAVQDVRENDPTSYKMYRDMIPTNKIATPNEVANAVIWLCSDESSAVTGTLNVVDGGSSI